MSKHLMRLAITAVLGLGVIGCGGGGDASPTAPPVPSTKNVQVYNYLYTPITLAIGGTSYGSVSAASSSPGSANFDVPGTTTTLSFIVQPFRYGDGTPIPNDLSGGSVALGAASLATITVNNIVSGQPHYAFGLTNRTGVAIDVGVFSNGATRCLLALPINGFAQMGYFTLTSTSEVRYYRGGSACTGAYRFWSTAQLSAYEANTGGLTLSASVAP